MGEEKFTTTIKLQFQKSTVRMVLIIYPSPSFPILV
jgi:hypothetical protein